MSDAPPKPSRPTRTLDLRPLWKKNLPLEGELQEAVRLLPAPLPQPDPEVTARARMCGRAAPSFVPTDEQRRTVWWMAAYGVDPRNIANALDINLATLTLNFRIELEHAALQADTEVVKSLYTMATVDKNVAAAIFWLKARRGWREIHKHEIGGEGDGPIKITIGPTDASL